MTVSIDWSAFLLVFVASFIGAVSIVFFYALGLRMLVRSGRVPVVSPAEFTDAITVVTEKEMRKAEKQAAKAARKSPLTEAQKQLSYVAAIACFALCAIAVIAGIVIIIAGR